MSCGGVRSPGRVGRSPGLVGRRAVAPVVHRRLGRTPRCVLLGDAHAASWVGPDRDSDVTRTAEAHRQRPPPAIAGASRSQDSTETVRRRRGPAAKAAYPQALGITWGQRPSWRTRRTPVHRAGETLWRTARISRRLRPLTCEDVVPHLCTGKFSAERSVHLLAIWDSPGGMSTIAVRRCEPPISTGRAQDHGGRWPVTGRRTLGCPYRGPPPAPDRRWTARSCGSPLPAFLALVAEPLFLLADAAIVGHLGTAPLAGLGIAAVGAADRGRAVRLPGLRHHRQRRPPARRRRPARRRWPRASTGSGWPSVIGVLVTAASGSRPTGPLVGAVRRRAGGDRPGDDVPADRLPRHHPAAGHAGHDRRAARPPGHPHPAGRRGRRQRPQRRAQPAARLRPAVGGLGIAGSALGLGARPGGQRRRASVRSWSAAPGARAPRCAPTCPASGGRPTPASPWSSAPSPCAPRCWSRRTPSCSARTPHPGRPGGDLATHQLAMTIWTLPGVRPRRDRDRRAGDHRPLPRRRRRRPAPGRVTRRMVRWGVVSGVVHRACCSRRPARSSGRCSPATRASRTCSCPVLLVAALGQPVAGVVFVLDGVLIGAGDGTLPGLGGPGRPRGLRAGRAARRRPRRRPGRGLGRRSRRVFMGARLVVLVPRAAATPGWSPASTATPMSSG